MIELSHSKQINWQGTKVLIKDADFKNPFSTGLEYSSPARGPWNIVHTGMLIPESHQIFVCAQSCLRGVVLTAAELGVEERFSTITIKENNLYEGDMETVIIEGVKNILLRLPYKPKAILLFTSCIHHFMGTDLKYIYDRLKKELPNIDITDCYMNPTMRKTLTPPDIKMREQLYSVLHSQTERDNGVNFIGNNFATNTDGELEIIFNSFNCISRDICNAKTYKQFQEMAKSCLSIITNPAAILAGKTLEQRLGIPQINLPLSYDYDEIDNSLFKLTEKLNTLTNKKINLEKIVNIPELRRTTEETVNNLSEILHGTPIAIDYTATSRPLGLAEFLLAHKINVISVYADNFNLQEKNSFERLKTNYPELELYATINPKMAVLPSSCNGISECSFYSNIPCSTEKNNNFTLAIGQKAAFFTNTKHFVNLIEGGGLWGYSGLIKLLYLIEDAFKNEKNTAQIIQVKGWGCLS